MTEAIISTKHRAAEIAVKRFIDADGTPSEEFDVTDELTDAEIQALVDGLEDGEWARVDAAIECIEGRVPWPTGDSPSILTAEDKAGGADRNRGNAEVLRRYWKYKKGGTEIRWGTPHDFYRCVEHLSKYMGERAKGYCALRHHEMTGVWPGKGQPV